MNIKNTGGYFLGPVYSSDDLVVDRAWMVWLSDEGIENQFPDFWNVVGQEHHMIGCRNDFERWFGVYASAKGWSRWICYECYTGHDLAHFIVIKFK
jgi:hypothetical protein